PLLADAGAPLIAFPDTLWSRGEYRCDMTVENGQGGKVVYDLLRTPQVGERGDVRGTVVVGREVTAARRTVRESQRYLSALEASRAMIVLLRVRDRRIVYANGSAAAAVGQPAERLAGVAGERLFPDLEEPGIGARLSRMADGLEESCHFETMLMRWDGRLLPVEVALARMAPPGDEPHFVLSCRDITDRRRAEKALRIVMGGIARETGDHFFRSLGLALLNNLNLTGVALARIVSDTTGRVATLALTTQNGPLPPWDGLRDDLVAAPCLERREPITFRAESLAAAPRDPLASTGPDGIRGIPLFDVEGRVIGLLWVGFRGAWDTVGVDDDIVRLFALRAGAELERVAAAEALRRSEEKYRRLFEWREWILEHSPEGIVHLDADLRIQFISPAMARILGAPESGPVVIGKRIDEIPPMVAAGITEALVRLPEGKEVSVEREYTSLYGKSSYVSVKGIPTFEEGRFTGAVLLVSDISDIHAAAEALTRSERFLAQAQRLAHVGSFDWDFTTDTVVFSDELFRIFGHEPWAFVPTPETFYKGIHPDDVTALMRMRADDIAHRRRFAHRDYRVVWPDGAVRNIMSSAEYTYDERGNPLRLVGTIHDITDAQQIQEALRRAQKLESLGLMAGGVAHDFNNLLVGIIGNISLALDEIAPDDPARETVARSLVSARRAADLANQMLAYSGRGIGEREPVALPPLIEELADFLAAGLPKTVTIDYRLDPATPLTLGDATQLRQVVMNLVINGAEAIGERSGTVIVTTGAVRLDAPPAGLRFGGEAPPPGDYVAVAVEDDGCGMSQEILDRIFDPFFTTKFTGRGLGLAAILGIVQMTKGYLGVRSTPGKGACFTVWLPVAPPHLRPRVEGAAPTEPEGNEPWRGGGTVLLVDDEETVRHVAGRILTRAGFTVVTAVDGLDGLEKYKAAPEPFRLLIIDMTMPRMDGLSLLKELRALGCLLPALISSGYDDRSAGAAFTGLSPLALLRKPYTRGEFLKGVGDLLKATERERG
ncbi:MAG: PAS domain S-box protein, partial [Nitrospinae bacterium]|nr:PAS domain S-box protein [Nitrospinota bacterium]